MKDTILAFLVSRAGGIVTPVLAAIVAWGVAQLAAWDASLAARVDEAAVVGFLWAVIMSGVNAWTNRIQTDGVKRIQALVNTDEDGVPGPITYIEVRRATGK